MRLIRLTKQDKARIQQILKRYLDREEVQSMHRFVQHGRTSTYAHSVNVVKLSYWLNKKFHLNADERALLTGALLHDFYLYDWHEKSDWHKWHGFSHRKKRAADYREPYVAADIKACAGNKRSGDCLHCG